MAARLHSAAEVRSAQARSRAALQSVFWLQMQADLHDLCQPLTALQFHLQAGELGDCEALRRAVRGSLEETRRLFQAVAAMRHHIVQELEPKPVGTTSMQANSSKP